MNRNLQLVLFAFSLWFALIYCAFSVHSTYVCPVDSDTAEGLTTYRYNLVCQSIFTTDCYLQQKFDQDAYSNFVIILHNKNWDVISNITENFARCNVNYILIDIDHPTIDLSVSCSTARSTIIFDFSQIGINHTEIIFPGIECALQTSMRKKNIFNIISSTCPNTIWIMGSVNCSHDPNSSAVKLFTFENEKDILSDYEVGRQYLKGKHLRLGMIVSPPYFMQTETNGVVMYSGILFNLLEKLSKTLQFTYSIHFPKDGKYGALKDDGTWSGMVGQLINNETDIALADLTVTYPRSHVIDFSTPYWFESIGIMIQQQDLESKLWKMFSLFSFNVWITILGSFFASSGILFFLHKFSPIRLRSPFNKLSECFWFSISCFSNQGSEYDPESWSVQNFMAFFWLYVFSLLSIYSGGLIAMLTSSRMSLPFKDLEGLGQALQQGKFKLTVSQGTASTSAIMAGGGQYGPIRDWLLKNPSYTVPREDTFKILLENKDVAVVDEVTTMEGVQREYCRTHKLIILNDRFFPGFFSFGLQKNSTLNEILSREITATVDEGLIQGWKVNFTSGVNSFCEILQPDDVIKADSNALALSEFTGPFLLMGIGIAGSVIWIFVEKRRRHMKKRSYSPNSPKVTNVPRRSVLYGKRNPRNNHWIRY